MKKLFTAVLLLMVIIVTAQEKEYTCYTMSYWEYAEDIQKWEEIDIMDTHVLITFKGKETLIQYYGDRSEEVLVNHTLIDTYVNTDGRTINAYDCYYKDTRVLLTIDDLGDMRITTETDMVIYHNITRISKRNGLESLR